MSVALLVQHAWRGLRDVDHEVARLAEGGRVLTVAGGDVSLRDIPKAHEFLAGRFFSDPYYRGEPHWYPFLTPLLAATWARVSGAPVPEAYFRLEVMLATFYLAAVGIALVLWFRHKGLLLALLALATGLLTPGHGLYPGEAARGALILLLVGAGALHAREHRRWWHWALLGLGVGTLGLWHGASFFTTVAVVGVVALVALVRAPAGSRLTTWINPAVFLVAVAVPMTLLLGPQLTKYGRLTAPRLAATYLDALYQNGSWTDAVRLALLPRNLGLLLVVAFFVRFALGRRLTPRPAIAPLGWAFGLALIVGHLGFLLADRRARAVWAPIKALLPAPPHTFAAVANALLPVVYLLGAVALVEIAWMVLSPRWKTSSRFEAGGRWLPLVGAGLALVVAFRPPSMPPRHAASEDRGFFTFARQVAQTIGNDPVFFLYPGRFVQAGSLKIPLLSVYEYASPYVQERRNIEMATLETALRMDNFTAVDRFLTKGGYRTIMEDQHTREAQPILRCAGDPLMAGYGYVLRPYVGCRP
jgi:hypothetical protein